ncbi:MAG TPA: hypothetical protein VI612_03690 [Candidatus Nanoarchaeia archaeon]|nr:hypothetical protein [Candidatus Nanoarchaeia archaeon]
MKWFVWDLHGVLECGAEEVVEEITNEVLQSSGYSRRISTEENLALYGRKWFEYFAHLLPGEPHERYLELQAACFAMSAARPDLIARHIRPTLHAHFVLDTIARSEGNGQVLISNTQPQSLPVFLRTLDMTAYFPPEYALAVGAHNGTSSKREALEGFLRDKQVSGGVSVSDSPEDMPLSEIVRGQAFLYAHPDRPFRDCDTRLVRHRKIRDLRDVLLEL